jgi:hypothetical protein
MSFLRYEIKDSAGSPNPLAGNWEKSYGYGASLAGRVVREFIYEGWNRDAAGRRVFDVVLTHTGVGRLFFNMRFAQVAVTRADMRSIPGRRSATRLISLRCPIHSEAS